MASASVESAGEKRELEIYSTLSVIVGVSITELREWANIVLFVYFP